MKTLLSSESVYNIQRLQTYICTGQGGENKKGMEGHLDAGAKKWQQAWKLGVLEKRKGRLGGTFPGLAAIWAVEAAEEGRGRWEAGGSRKW